MAEGSPAAEGFSGSGRIPGGGGAAHGILTMYKIRT